MTIQQINAACSDAYGCGILAIDATGALWLAERIMSETGNNVFRKLSSHRNKHGKGTTFPAYGTPLFSTM